MVYPLYCIFRLTFGTLYPAYQSFKAVSTKNVREYVKWMMYWIVFAAFSGIETVSDIFVSFWFPFYYEIKILVLLYMISPVHSGSLGSSLLYRRFLHPNLSKREKDIDVYLAKIQEHGYNSALKFCQQGFSYLSQLVMQTAIRGGGGILSQLKKSISLSDLSKYEEETESSMNTMSIQHISEESEMYEVPRRQVSRHQSYVFPEVEARMTRSQFMPKIYPSLGGLSSGYSSTSEFLPSSEFEPMETGDYELYDPRIHGRLKGQLPVTRSIKKQNKKESKIQESENSTTEMSRRERNYPLDHSHSLPIYTPCLSFEENDESEIWSEAQEFTSTESESDGDKTPLPKFSYESKNNSEILSNLTMAAEKLNTVNSLTPNSSLKYKEVKRNRAPNPPSSEKDSESLTKCPHCTIHTWLPHSLGCPKYFSKNPSKIKNNKNK